MYLLSKKKTLKYSTFCREAKKMASGGLRADTTFYPGLLYQEVGVVVVVVVDKKTAARHMLDTTTILHILHTSIPCIFCIFCRMAVRHISDTSVKPITVQYSPYSPVLPTTA